MRCLAVLPRAKDQQLYTLVNWLGDLHARVQGKIKLPTKGIYGWEDARKTTVSCWAFAAFDGHAGSGCSHFLKENFMVSLITCIRLYHPRACRARWHESMPQSKVARTSCSLSWL